MVEHIAQHERGSRQPRNTPQRGEIRLQDEIAIAFFPIGHCIARHRLHIDVVGEQIVAAMRLLMRASEEILGLEALADESSLHVGEAGDDRVDLAGAHGLLQFFQGQHAGHSDSSLYQNCARAGLGPAGAAYATLASAESRRWPSLPPGYRPNAS